MTKSEYKYELIGNDYEDERGLPRGHDIFFRCTSCATLVPSVPKDDADCECGNICLDTTLFRTWVNNFKNFEVVKKIKIK